MKLFVERLTLRLASLSEADGRRLVHLVGEHLATAKPSVADGRIASLRISIEPRHGEALETLAQRITAEMLRSLGRLQ
jgi:hypothetical protein